MNYTLPSEAEYSM